MDEPTAIAILLAVVARRAQGLKSGWEVILN
jgi:hypothetical protein